MMDLPFRLIPRAPAGRTDKTLMRPSTRLLLGHIRPATPTNRPGPSRQITFKTSRQSEAESDPNRSHPQYHQPEAQPVLTSEVGHFRRGPGLKPEFWSCIRRKPGHPAQLTGHPTRLTGHPAQLTGHPTRLTGHPTRRTRCKTHPTACDRDLTSVILRARTNNDLRLSGIDSTLHALLLVDRKLHVIAPEIGRASCR